MNLSPYAKTVVTAVGTLVAVVFQYLAGDGADATTLGTAIIGLLTTLGVFQVTNTPLPEKGSAVEPSTHEVTDNVVALSTKPKPKPRPRPSSKAVKNAKKVTERRVTDKKGE